MPRVVIPIFFDYASTLCYIAWRIVRELEPELGFDALWKGVPIALRDFSAIAGRALTELERQKVLMVAAETGIAVAPLARWIDSSAALEGSELARDAGVFAAYHEAVFRAAFEDRADIAAPATLDEIAARRAQARGRRAFGARLSDLYPRRFPADRNPARRDDALAACTLHPPARDRTAGVGAARGDQIGPHHCPSAAIHASRIFHSSSKPRPRGAAGAAIHSRIQR